MTDKIIGCTECGAWHTSCPPGGGRGCSCDWKLPEKCPECGCLPMLQDRFCKTCIEAGRMELQAVGGGGNSVYGGGGGTSTSIEEVEK